MSNLTPDEILPRWLAQECSQEELEELEIQFRDNPKLRIEFDFYKRTYDTPIRSVEPSPRIWNAIESRVNTPQSRLNGNNFLQYRWISAAIIFIAFGIYYWATRPEFITITAKAGELQSITLPDRSIATLNASSSLTYDRNNWSRNRIINMTGEVFFDVQKNKGTFIVNSQHARITVQGTKFNVRDRQGFTRVACAEGQVRVKSNQESDDGVILIHGLETHFDSLHYAGVPSETDEHSIGSWQRGEWFYSNTPLREVLNEIERRYRVSIENSSPLNFTGKIAKLPLAQVLNIVKLATGLQYEAVSDSVYRLY